MADDEKKTDDLMSRRQRSGSPSESDAPADAANTGSAESPESGAAEQSGSAMDDTVTFDAFPAVKPQASSKRTDTTSASKPSMLSDEEWAAITGTDAPTSTLPAATDHTTGTGTPATNAGAGAAGATAAGKPLRRHRYNVGDVIASVWLALATPFVLIALGVRVVASGLFLKFEYFYRPGFPADPYGFSAADRMHYGSYTVDYLSNLDGKRYLADVVQGNSRVFTQPEIAHMADVKNIISLLYLVAVVAIIGAIIAGLYLSRTRGPGMRMGVRWGAILTLVLVVAAVVVALLGFDRFFTGLHHVLFPQGNWEFYVDDSLIRLFPQAFWVDAGIAGGGLVVIVALVLLAITAIGRSKRKAIKTAKV